MEEESVVLMVIAILFIGVISIMRLRRKIFHLFHTIPLQKKIENKFLGCIFDPVPDRLFRSLV